MQLRAKKAVDPMSNQNAPEFNQPSRGKHSPKPGDTVSFRDLNGVERVGKVTDSSPGGTFDVVSNNITYYRRAEEMFPIGGPASSASSKPVAGSSHTPQGIARHLAAGGEAYYTPGAHRYGPDAGKLDLRGGRESERVPLHSVWLGDEKNLVDLIDFDDVAAGSASIDLGPASPPKQKPPRAAHPFDRLSDKEVSTFIHTGASKAFEGVPAEDRARQHGGHSLDSLLGNRKSATQENVSAFLSSMRTSREGNSLDATQAVLDGVGLAGDAVAPGAGVAADGTNAVISLMRAASDPGNAGTHLTNAAISTVSMVPFVGDLAKVFKYGGKGARAAGKAGKAGKAARAAGVSAQFQGFLATDSDSAADDPQSESSDESDPLSSRSANVKDKVIEFGSVVGKASAATLTAANSISLMNRAAVEYHRELVHYNGRIAEAYGKLEADRAGRSIERGHDLSGPLSVLVESQSKLEEKLQDFSSPWKVLGADIARILTEILAVGVAILDFLEPLSNAYADHVRPALVRLGILDGPAEVKSSGWFGKIQKDYEDNAKKPRKV